MARAVGPPRPLLSSERSPRAMEREGPIVPDVVLKAVVEELAGPRTRNEPEPTRRAAPVREERARYNYD